MENDPLPNQVQGRYVANVYWFRRPPYLRWAAAALLVMMAVWLDLRPEPTERRPFAAVDLAEGTVIEKEMIDWKAVPADLLPDPGDPVGTVSRSVAAGEPLVSSAVARDRVAAPPGWWTLEITLPHGTYPGQSVHLVVLSDVINEPPEAISGMVIAPAPPRDPLAMEDVPGLVAVPAESAVRAAAAAAESAVTVILGN